MLKIDFIFSKINRSLNIIDFMFIIIHMETETKILDKYMRKMFPFIIRIEEIEHVGIRRYSKDNKFNLELRIHIYVSPTHFCELMDNRVDIKMNEYLYMETSSMIKSLIPDVGEGRIKFIFFPDIDSVTIFDNLISPIN